MAFVWPYINGLFWSFLAVIDPNSFGLVIFSLIFFIAGNILIPVIDILDRTK